MAVQSHGSFHSIKSQSATVTLVDVESSSNDRVKVSGFQLRKSVADGSMELRFNDGTTQKSIMYQPSPVANAVYGWGDAPITGPKGAKLELVYAGSGEINGEVKADRV